MTGTPRPAAVLIGPPGCGKTTVGALLAARWGMPFVDTDALVEERAGASVAQIFVEQGEAAFRALERAAVAEALQRCPGVVALGGGAVMDPDTAAALAGHRVVFLDVGIADAAKRVGFDRSRPLLAVNPRARWVELMGQRRATYQELATVRVDTAGLPAQAVTDRVASALADDGPARPATTTQEG